MPLSVRFPFRLTPWMKRVRRSALTVLTGMTRMAGQACGICGDEKVVVKKVRKRPVNSLERVTLFSWRPSRSQVK